MFDDKVKAFFTKKSDGNLAFHTVEEKEYASVQKARGKLAESYGINISKLKFMEQIHTDEVKIVGDDSKYICDALITNKKDTPLMIMSADCIGILFYDPVKLVIGVAHAGRNGTFLNIAQKTLQAMQNQYNTNPKDIRVAMGASIQKCCYEVSTQMAQMVKKNFGERFVDYRNIDLQGINKKQLLDLGVKKENMQISDVCTKCSKEDYFSYRSDNSCGRFAGIISILDL